MKLDKRMGILLLRENEDSGYMPELYTFDFDPKTQTLEDAQNIMLKFVKNENVVADQFFIFDMRIAPFIVALFDTAKDTQKGPDEHDTIN